MKHTNKFTLLFFLLSLSFFSNAQVVINEIQTSNTKTFFDENYNYDDWIEIYNSGASSVNLNGYGLSDDSLKPYKFIFPDYTLAAGSYVTVFAADTNSTNLTHWETAVKASDTWKYRANTSAPSSTNWRDPAYSDASWSSGIGGIGMSDSDDGTTISGCVSVYMRRSFTISDTSKIFDAVFNMDYDDGFVAYLNGVEIARVNLGTPGNFPIWNEYAPLSHEAVLYQNQYPDSFHLDYNKVRSLLVNGTNVLAVETHNQSGTYTDMSSNPFLSFSVKNGSILFSSTPSWFHKAATTFLHANFKISKTGETVFLTNATNNLLDKKSTGNLEIDNSIARVPDGSANWCLTDIPTPNASNNATVCKTGYATFPIFSLIGGFYTGSRTLTLSTVYPGGTIRYTTDGSNVKETSTLYTGPITISSTQTIRARVFATNVIGSTTVTHTYFINLTCRMPVVSLTTDPANLYDYNSGIFADGPGYTSANPHFGANYWLDLEKDVTVEYYERDKSLQFQFNAGLAVTGGWSRAGGQKSLEIKLGDKYGLSNLNFSLQSLKPWNDKWNDFILHMAGNDRDICHMRDALMNRVLKPTFNNYIAYEPCLLMLNGANWGIYYFRENDDHHWVEGNYGYKPSEIDFLKESYFYSGIEVKKGSDSAFFAMYDYATTASPSDADYYSTISKMMDLQNMADYFIAETYYPNDDWMGGGNNNLKLWRPKKGDGKFKYLIYDLEFGLGYSGSVSNNMLATARNPSPHNYNSDIFDAFTQNPTYKRYFINRYADLINTIFLPSNIQTNAYALRDSMKYDYHFQNQKWSGADSSQWISNIATMMTFANNRPAYARNFVQSEYGMTSQVNLTLQVSPAGAGVIQISTITPTSYPWNGVYFNGNPVTITAIPNPGYTFDHFRSNVVISSNNTNQSVTYNFTSSDAITCYFTGSSASPQLAFSELNFHSDTLHEAGDWIEIHNRANYAIDLSNWIFRDEADNHTYKFPVTTSVPANGYLVLASDLEKFTAIHPTVSNVIGDFKFDFSNNSEELRLFDRNDQLYTSFIYSDQLPFPSGADAGGYTMERLDETTIADDGNNWFAGCLLGSPGRAYSGPSAQISAPSTTTICSGSSVTLNVNSVSGATYQWFKDNVAMSGSTGTSINVTNAGSYFIQVNAEGCSASSASIALTTGNVEQISSVTDAARCGAGSVALSAVGTSVLNWFADSTTAAILFTGSTLNTPSISLTTNYFVQASGSCPSVKTRVVATFNDVTTAPIASDVSRCGIGALNISASATSTISWYDAATGGSLVYTGTTFTTPSLNTSVVYYLSAGTICPSPRVAVNAFVNAITTAPIVTNASNCGPGSLLLVASDTAVINWYSAASGGTLLYTGTNYNTPVISTTTNYYVEAGSICSSARVVATATIDVVAAPPTVADVSRCGNGTITLTSNSSTTAWYSASSGGTLLATGISFTTPALNNTTTYYVQSGTTCPSSRVAVNAIVNSVTADPTVVSSDRCGNGTLTLTAVDTAVVRWYSSAVGGATIYTGSTFTTPSLTQTTTYYTEAGNECISNRIPVIATVNPITPNPSTTDVSHCGAASFMLQATSSSIVNWFDAPNGNLLSTGSSFTTPFLSSSTSYYIQAGIDCPSAFVQVNATIDAISADPTVSSNNRCGNGSVSLQASSPDVLNWYDAPSGTLLFSGSNFVTPSIPTTTTYFVQAGNVCTSNFVPVTATINRQESDPTTVGAASCGPASVVLLANGSGIINWFDAINGTIIFTGNSLTTPVVTTTTILYVQTAGLCPSNFVPVEATINPISTLTVSDASSCGSGILTLYATSTESISWFDAPGGNLLATGSSFVTPMLTSSVQYFAVAGGICPSTPMTVNANINSNPLITLGNDTAIESGNSITLDAGTGFATYLWNTSASTRFLTTGISGDYSVLVTDVNGCSASDTITISVVSKTGSLATTIHTDVYPNPFSDQITVSLGNISSDVVAKLFTADGKIVFENIIDKLQKQFTLDATNFASGVYFLSLENKESKIVKRIVKR